MGSDILLSMQHLESKRWVIFEDDGDAGWLYVTGPDSLRPESSCFVYNRMQPPASIGREHPHEVAPPVTRGYASSEAVVSFISEADLEVRWSPAGAAAVVLERGDPRAMVVVGEPLGWSKGLSRDGPYGHPWSPTNYERFFPSSHR